MKKLIAVFVFGITCSPLFGQVVSSQTSMHFDATSRVVPAISAQSNLVKYGSPLVMSGQSDLLSFGSPNTKNEPMIVKTEPVVQQKMIAAVPVEKQVERAPDPVPDAVVPTLAVSVPERGVAVATPKIMGAELGEEYALQLPRYHAVIIGVSNYKYAGLGFESLENPAKDAKELYNVLTEHYTFDPADVTFMQDPTRRQIIDEFEGLAARIGPKDNLFIFYAGHGYYDKSKELGYWLPSDARINSRSDWIGNSTIKDYLSSINTKHTLLVTDACFGGSIFKTRSVDAFGMMKVYDLYKNPSRKAITSGNLTEVPDNSMFLQQLLKKLNENPDDFLPAQKLFTRIYEPVTNNSTAIPKFGVIQGAGDEGGDFIFVHRPK